MDRRHTISYFLTSYTNLFMKLPRTKNRNSLFAMALFFCIITNVMHAQVITKEAFKLRPKEYILPCISMLVSGMLDGTIETINWHYADGFKRVLPHVNDRFWNPAISWVNKYKNGNQNLGPAFVGSTTILVGFTDGYHALRISRNYIDAFTISFYINRACHQSAPPKFCKLLVDALIFAAIRDIGFSTTYSLIFREGSHG